MNSEKINLICLHYAGGNVYSYAKLKPFLKEDINLIALELPGRGKRMAEPLLENTTEMVADLYQQILPHLGREYILYGHSMGGIIGSLLLHYLKARRKKMPLWFFATGCAAPKSNKYKKIRHLLEDFEFKQELKELGGFSNEVLTNDELMDFLLPIMRADFKALEIDIYKNNGKYEVPITSIRGTDEVYDKERQADWTYETTAPVEILAYSGNHFFILDHFDKIASLIHEKASSLAK